MEYYVYVYLDPRKSGKFKYAEMLFDFLPFYVGKGKGNRLYDHLDEKRKCNPHKSRIIEKIKKDGLEPIVFTLLEHLSEESALLFEVEVISKIGRFDKKSGPLTNLTDGGDGSSGYIQSWETKEKRHKSLFEGDTNWKRSGKTHEFSKLMSKATHFRNEDFKKALSERYKGSGNPMYGKKSSEKQKESVRNAHLEGKIKLSDEGRKKIVEAGKRNKGRKLNKKRSDVIEYKLISPNNEKFMIYGAKELQEFCKKNKLQYHVLKKHVNLLITKSMVQGERINAKNTIGWKIEI